MKKITKQESILKIIKGKARIIQIMPKTILGKARIMQRKSI